MQKYCFRHILLLAGVIITLIGYSEICAQYSDDLFTRTYGMDGNDQGSHIIKSDDGGYAFVGVLETLETNSEDLWFVKLDSTGNMVWQEVYGGPDADRGRRVIPCSDGCYLLAGYTQSYGNGGWDGYVIKVDASGYVVWDSTYGDESNDYIFDAIAGEDGSYIMAGAKTSLSDGVLDFWVFQIDSLGNVEWETTLHRFNQDQARAIIKSSNGGYFVAGHSDRKLDQPLDIWLVKLDTNGDSLWSVLYEGEGRDASFCISEMSNDNLMIVGYSETEENERDIQILVTDQEGNLVASSTFGGPLDDEGHGLNATLDGNYIITGFTESEISGEWDLLMLKVDEEGNEIWSKSYGGLSKDFGQYVFHESLNRYVCLGLTESFGNGGSDAWIIWTDDEGDKIPPTHSVFPFISNISDISNDQGGWVEVEFYRSAFDMDSLVLPKAAAPQLYTVEIDDGSGWMAAASTVAYGKSIYSVLVPTTKDSTSDDNGLIDFRVIAGMEEGNYVSPVTSGYSVDNLKPEVPEGVAGSVSEGNKILLSWQTNQEKDLDHYTVYRSENGSSFKMLAQTTDTDYTDSDIIKDVNYSYTITASDYSGNESGQSEIVEFNITKLNTENKLPMSFYLSQNFPNPFNPVTTIKYGLLNAGDVKIRVFDILGNLVTELINQYQNKGHYQVIWKGTNSQHEQVSSGIYYYQIIAEDFQDIKKMILVR